MNKVELSLDPIVWTPPAIETTRVGAFIDWVNRHYGTGLSTYEQLHAWSVESGGQFWKGWLEFSGITFIGDADRIVSNTAVWPRPEWFPNITMNFAENMLRGDDKQIAIIFYSEHQPVQTITMGDLRQQVAQTAAWLTLVGIGRGDVIAAFVPNCPEAVVLTLAAASVGAVWTACSPDSGTQFALDRFVQTTPKLLVSVDGYVYDSKIFSVEDKLQELRDGLPSILSTVVISRVPGFVSSDGVVPYSDIVDPNRPVPPLVFEQLGFSHPLYILYSSGTTGKPKCLVHSAGGTLLQHTKEHQLQCNLSAGDCLMYYTTTSWMMWNWLITGLASGVTIALFEGKPDPSTVWEFIESAKITAFGTSAPWISLCQKTGAIPNESQVRTVNLLLSTGSALLREHFDFIHQKIKPDVQIASISGGTDIVSCFVGGGPVPVRRGRLQCAGLGMAVEVWSESGTRVFDVQGELVCTQPFPCMPVYFLNDPDSEKFHSAYFQRFPGVWTHGDNAIEYSDGGIEIVGRSDSTIKHHGVRIGTGDLYNILEGISEIKDSLVVGRRVGDDEDIVLFLVLQRGCELDSSLKRDIRVALTAQSPWFKPDAIFSVSDIPVTANGKKSEILIKNLLNGVQMSNLSVIRNPECLEEYRAIAKQMVDTDASKRSRLLNRKERAS